ncbi:MAG: hypothetical protein WC683_13095 [bacterium]
MAVQFSREQMEALLKNVAFEGDEGEALVVLTQGEYDRLAAEASRRTQDVPPWAESEGVLIWARERGNFSSWGYDYDSHGQHVYFTRTALDARRQFRGATRADAARQAAEYAEWITGGRQKTEPKPAPGKPEWVGHHVDEIKIGLQSAKGPCATACRGKCWWECEYEQDGKCAVVQFLDDNDPGQGDTGGGSIRCDIGFGEPMAIGDDERTKANVQECWRRRLAMGEAFGVEE